MVSFIFLSAPLPLPPSKIRKNGEHFEPLNFGRPPLDKSERFIFLLA